MFNSDDKSRLKLARKKRNGPLGQISAPRDYPTVVQHSKRYMRLLGTALMAGGSFPFILPASFLALVFGKFRRRPGEAGGLGPGSGQLIQFGAGSTVGKYEPDTAAASGGQSADHHYQPPNMDFPHQDQHNQPPPPNTHQQQHAPGSQAPSQAYDTMMDSISLAGRDRDGPHPPVHETSPMYGLNMDEPSAEKLILMTKFLGIGFAGLGMTTLAASEEPAPEVIAALALSLGLLSATNLYAIGEGQLKKARASWFPSAILFLGSLAASAVTLKVAFELHDAEMEARS